MDLSVRTETFGQDDQSWLGSAHGTDATRTVALDVSTFTPATHYPKGYLPSGLPLEKLDSGRYGLLSADGTLAGYLYTAQKVTSPAQAVVVGPIYEHGKVKTAKLPVPVTDAQQATAAGRIIHI